MHDLADFQTRGGFANTEAGSQMLPALSEFLRRADSLPAAEPTPFLCSCGPAGSLPDEMAFELRQRPEQMEDQATAGCRGVSVFGDGSKA